jgi:hypothetical protein
VCERGSMGARKRGCVGRRGLLGIEMWAENSAPLAGEMKNKRGRLIASATYGAHMAVFFHFQKPCIFCAGCKQTNFYTALWCGKIFHACANAVYIPSRLAPERWWSVEGNELAVE